MCIEWEYTARVIRYAITNLRGYGCDREHAQRSLLKRMEAWVADGIDLVQLREKELEAGELYALAEQMVRLARGSRTQVLVNGRLDVAVAAGANGVHLPAEAGALQPKQVRAVFAAADATRPVISASCHTFAEVERAVEADVDFLLFGPVFEKQVGGNAVMPGLRLPLLGAAVRVAGKVPVVALGGVTAERIPACLAEGAAGIAGIRLFSLSA